MNCPTEQYVDLDNCRVLDINRFNGELTISLQRNNSSYVVRAIGVSEEIAKKYISEGATSPHPNPNHPIDLVEVAERGDNFIEFQGYLNNEPWYVWRVNAEHIEVSDVSAS